MQKLADGVQRFRKDVFRTREQLFSKLSKGQSPEALFITCSDSRIDPGLLTQTEPGDLFIIRNAGNIVPPYGAGAGGGETPTIEYAVSVLKVKEIIVCGHSLCGAMNALLHPEQLTGLPAVGEWVKHAETTRRIITENYRDLDEQQLMTAAIQENVLVQLDHLQTHPAVAAATARGDLTLFGWVYQIETGQVFAYDPEQGRFQLLEGRDVPAYPAAGYVAPNLA